MSQVTQMEGVNGGRDTVVGDFNDWPNEAGFESLYEQKTPVELQVQGNIQNYAAGVFHRQGPRNHEVEGTPNGTYKVHHPSGIKVRYNSRFACDLIIQEIGKEGKWNSFTFGQKRDPCVSFFAKVMSSFQAMAVETLRRPLPDPTSENVCVTFSIDMPGLPTTIGITNTKSLKNAVAKGDTSKPGHASGVQSLYSTTDSPVFKQLDPETLEPIGLARQDNLHPSLKGPMSGAHARADPVTGNLYNYNLDFVRSPTYRVFCVSASTGTVSAASPSMRRY